MTYHSFRPRLRPACRIMLLIGSAHTWSKDQDRCPLLLLPCCVWRLLATSTGRDSKAYARRKGRRRGDRIGEAMVGESEGRGVGDGWTHEGWSCKSRFPTSSLATLMTVVTRVRKTTMENDNDGDAALSWKMKRWRCVGRCREREARESCHASRVVALEKVLFHSTCQSQFRTLIVALVDHADIIFSDGTAYPFSSFINIVGVSAWDVRYTIETSFRDGSSPSMAHP